MVKKVLIGFGIVLVILVAFVGYTLLTTKNHSPQDTVTYTDNEGRKIEIVYCQPYKKDRLIFGSEDAGALVPYGKKWRTGANEATEIEFSAVVSIAGNEIPAGKYSVYTIPGENEWVVAINSKTDYWGAGFGDIFEEGQDAARITVSVFENEESLEQFTMKLSEGGDNIEWDLMWDNIRVTVPITFLN